MPEGEKEKDEEHESDKPHKATKEEDHKVEKVPAVEADGVNKAEALKEEKTTPAKESPLVTEDRNVCWLPGADDETPSPDEIESLICQRLKECHPEFVFHVCKIKARRPFDDDDAEEDGPVRSCSYNGRIYAHNPTTPVVGPTHVCYCNDGKWERCQLKGKPIQRSGWMQVKRTKLSPDRIIYPKY